MKKVKDLSGAFITIALAVVVAVSAASCTRNEEEEILPFEQTGMGADISEIGCPIRVSEEISNLDEDAEAIMTQTKFDDIKTELKIAFEDTMYILPYLLSGDADLKNFTNQEIAKIKNLAITIAMAKNEQEIIIPVKEGFKSVIAVLKKIDAENTVVNFQSKLNAIELKVNRLTEIDYKNVSAEAFKELDKIMDDIYAKKEIPEKLEE